MASIAALLASIGRWCHNVVQRVKVILGLRVDRIATYAGKPVSTDEGNDLVPLRRDQVLLVMLSLADGKPLTPVQVQKSLFLADDKAAEAFRDDSRYNFQPYDYGPFDSQVYADARDLARQGLVDIDTDPRGGWNTYAATDPGVIRGRELSERLDNSEREMLRRILKLVRSLSFTELVSAIYRAYPPMKERSVFRD